MKLLMTGGAGFIESAVICHIISNTDYSIAHVDKVSVGGVLYDVNFTDGTIRVVFF